MFKQRILFKVYCMLMATAVNADTIDTHGQQPFEQCGYCHEYDGNSKMPDFPRLAGQQKMYLVKQLNDFKSGKRTGDMQATAELLSDSDIKVIAEYFSQQVVTPAMSVNTNETTANTAAARQLFTAGDASRGIAACQDCHLPDARGAGVIPRLANQHPAYLKTQLHAFKNRQRKNDEAAFMRDVTDKLTDSEINALAQFLSTLNPAPLRTAK